MSEENRWGENLPETGGNAPKEGNALNTYGNTDTGSATGKWHGSYRDRTGRENRF